jgi:hypothetical protein
MPDLTRTAQKVLERIKNDPKVAENNKKYVEDFIVFLQAKGAHQRTVEKYVYQYERFLKAIGG